MRELRHTKQVIVIRKDLKMRRGKEIAQASHASMAFLTRRLQSKTKIGFLLNALRLGWFLIVNEHARAWMMNSYTKIALKTDSELEFQKLYGNARAAGLEVHLITDSGKTEFHGIPTETCFCIGPNYAYEIDAITRGLEPY